MLSYKKISQTILAITVLFLSAPSIKAQDMQDSTLSFPIIGFQYGFDIPAGTLAKSFGANSKIGASFWKKTSRNMLYGIAYNYIFGNDLKINPLDSISTSQGYLIDNAGQFAQNVQVFERGHQLMVKAGKIFRGLGPNPNCGITVMGGVGFWYHQVFYYWNQDQPNQVVGNYLYGYERITYGPALSESIGYVNFSNNKKVNFTIALEAVQGFTREYGYEYDVRKFDNSNHLDLSFGIKGTWFFPVYKSVKEKYYY